VDYITKPFFRYRQGYPGEQSGRYFPVLVFLAGYNKMFFMATAKVYLLPLTI